MINVQTKATPAAGTTPRIESQTLPEILEPQVLPTRPETTTATNVTEFIKDHFVNGGKLGISCAVAATRIAEGFAHAHSEILINRLPDIQRHLTDLPTALRAAVVSGGDAVTRDVLRTELVQLATDAGLAARSGALWGVTGLAYIALPVTVVGGYLVGAALGEQRANKMIMDALDGDMPDVAGKPAEAEPVEATPVVIPRPEPVASETVVSPQTVG